MDISNLEQQIAAFLREDIGLGDITTDSIFSDTDLALARFVAKESFVVAGIEQVAPRVFAARDASIECTALVPDGQFVESGTTIFEARGTVKGLLTAERVALNLAQRLSGIASLTAQFVKQVEGLPVKIVDTRKTTPGLRSLEKYAVRTGGGHNHRFNLADGIMIKDNHIAAAGGSITNAVETIKHRAPHTLKIEVETENLAQVQECLDCGVDIIMLDNMDLETMREAVNLVNGKALVEASGGVTLDSVREIAETGVDIISVGALTHSAPAVDISMRLQLAG